MSQDDQRPAWVGPAAALTVVLGIVVLSIVGTKLPHRDSLSDVTTSTVLTASTTTTTSTTTTAATTTASEQPPLVLAGWEDLGALGHVDATVGDTGTELIVFGGRFASQTTRTTLWSGVAIDHQTGAIRELPDTPVCKRSPQGSVWTGGELVVWSRGVTDGTCTVAAAYSPVTDGWRVLEADFFTEASTQVVWTGEELLSSNGYSYRPSTNETGQSVILEESPMFVGDGVFSAPLMHWTGSEILALGSKDVIEATPGGPLVDGPEPPVSDSGRTSVWTPEGLMAVSYEMDAALFRPETGEWESLPDVPLPMYECVPVAFADRGLVFVESCSGIAVWDGSGTWKLMTLPASSLPTYGNVSGQLAISGRYLYSLGAHLFRYRLPDAVDGALPSPQLLPLGNQYLDVPGGWAATNSYVGPTDPGTQTRQTVGVEVTAPEGSTCRVEWTDPGINPYVPAFTERATLTRLRGGEIPVGETAAGRDGQAHVVFFASDEWSVIDVVCSDLDEARALASHVWSSLPPPTQPPPGADDLNCYVEPLIGVTPGDTKIVVQLRLLNPEPCSIDHSLYLGLSDSSPTPHAPDIDGNNSGTYFDQILTPDRPYLIVTFTWRNWCSEPLFANASIGSYQAFARSVNVPCTDSTSPSTLELTSIEGPTATPALP